VVAQGFIHVPGVHYGEVFASTARFAAVRTVIAIAAGEDLELETVDISTVFLDGVEGEPRDGEDSDRWVVRLLRGLYGITQGPRLWALKIGLTIGFVTTSKERLSQYRTCLAT